MIISPSTIRIGWIGTGVMGSSMCGYLMAAGYSATVTTAAKAHSTRICQQRGDRLPAKIVARGKCCCRFARKTDLTLSQIDALNDLGTEVRLTRPDSRLELEE